MGCSSGGGGGEPQETAPRLPLWDMPRFSVAATPTDADGAATLRNAYDAGLPFAKQMPLLSLVSPAKSGTSWVWSVMAGALTVRIIGTPTAAGYDWTAILDGTDDTGTRFDNWTGMTGTSSRDLATGQMTVYVPNTTAVSSNLAYQRRSDGTYVLDLDTLMVELPEFVGRFVWTFRADLSGACEFYRGGALVLRATWNRDGSGRLTWYDAAGNQRSVSCWNGAGEDVACA